MTLPRPDVIFTHESDLDGFVAGILLHRLARHLFGGKIALEAHHYNYWKQRDLREKSAWATDLAFETTRNLAANVTRTSWVRDYLVIPWPRMNSYTEIVADGVGFIDGNDGGPRFDGGG